jgi:hypothetical protein
VEIIGVLPARGVPPSGFVVTPVLGWWREPSPVSPVDPAEVAAVHRVPLDELLNPANRVTARHPLGRVGPAFRVRDVLVWGFTAMLLDRLFRYVGWERPWDAGVVEDLPDHIVALSMRGRPQPPDTAPDIEE